MTRQRSYGSAIAYQLEDTSLGSWRRYTHPDGSQFAEYRSRHSLFGLPLLHYCQGISPSSGSREVARGVVAVGRVAVGIVALGQLSVGVVGIGQFSVGLLLGLGQLSLAPVVLGQVAIGLMSVGQLALGYVAIGQYGMGQYVLAQMGSGEHLWTQHQLDPRAQGFFTELWALLRGR